MFSDNGKMGRKKRESWNCEWHRSIYRKWVGNICMKFEWIIKILKILSNNVALHTLIVAHTIRHFDAIAWCAWKNNSNEKKCFHVKYILSDGECVMRWKFDRACFDIWQENFQSFWWTGNYTRNCYFGVAYGRSWIKLSGVVKMLQMSLCKRYKLIMIEQALWTFDNQLHRIFNQITQFTKLRHFNVLHQNTLYSSQNNQLNHLIDLQ